MPNGGTSLSLSINDNTFQFPGGLSDYNPSVDLERARAERIEKFNEVPVYTDPGEGDVDRSLAAHLDNSRERFEKVAGIADAAFSRNDEPVAGRILDGANRGG